MFEINSRASAKKEIQFLRKCVSISSEKEILDAAQKSSAGVIIIKRHKKWLNRIEPLIYKKPSNYLLFSI